MLCTILASTITDGIRIVVREDDNRPVTDKRRFMTHMEILAGNFVVGHYDLQLDEAYQDFLVRCRQSNCQ